MQRSNKSRSEDSEDSEESDVAYADAGDSDDESGHARQYRQKGHSYVYSISGAEGAWEEGHTSRTHMVRIADVARMRLTRMAILSRSGGGFIGKF